MLRTLAPSLTVILIFAASLNAQESDYQTLTAEGQKFVEAGNHTAAMKSFQQAAQASAHHANLHATALVNVASCQRVLQQYDQAHATLASTFELEGLAPHVRGNLHLQHGQLFEDQRRFDDAIAAYTQTKEVERVPGDYVVEAEIACGRCSFRTKDYAAAEAHFLAVIDHPDTPAIRKVGGRLWLGGTYVALRQPDNARAQFQAVLDDPSAKPWHREQAQDAMKRLTP